MKEIKMYSQLYVVIEVKGRTRAEFFKDVEKGDHISISSELNLKSGDLKMSIVNATKNKERKDLTPKMLKSRLEVFRLMPILNGEEVSHKIEAALTEVLTTSDPQDTVDVVITNKSGTEYITNVSSVVVHPNYFASFYYNSIESTDPKKVFVLDLVSMKVLKNNNKIIEMRFESYEG